MEHTTIRPAASGVLQAGGLHSPDHQGETASMIRRLHDEYSGVPVSVIADLVNGHFAVLGSAKVQTFRVILTERAVRRDLRDMEAAWTR